MHLYLCVFHCCHIRYYCNRQIRTNNTIKAPDPLRNVRTFILPTSTVSSINRVIMLASVMQVNHVNRKCCQSRDTAVVFDCVVPGSSLSCVGLPCPLTYARCWLIRSLLWPKYGNISQHTECVIVALFPASEQALRPGPFPRATWCSREDLHNLPSDTEAAMEVFTVTCIMRSCFLQTGLNPLKNRKKP